ncbi:MAG: sigma-70 family RNA polymerase sigma factor [Nanoarchaeota archaeon]
MERIARGDREAFSEFSEQYRQEVYKNALRFCPEYAEDVTQRVFTKIWIKRNFPPKEEILSWLYVITKNESISEKKRYWNKNVLLESSDEEIGKILENHPSNLDNPREYAISQEQHEFLGDSFNELKPEFRAVLIGSIEGKKYQEIAEEQKISIRTVRSRLNRGKIELKRKINKRKDLFA